MIMKCMIKYGVRHSIARKAHNARMDAQKAQQTRLPYNLVLHFPKPTNMHTQAFTKASPSPQMEVTLSSELYQQHLSPAKCFFFFCVCVFFLVAFHQDTSIPDTECNKACARFVLYGDLKRDVARPYSPPANKAHDWLLVFLLFLPQGRNGKRQLHLTFLVSKIRTWKTQSRLRGILLL